MTVKKTHEKIWSTTKSGLIVPSGVTSDLSQYSRQTYLDIKDKAIAIEKVYVDNKLSLPLTCDLVRLIEDAKNLSDLWLVNRTGDISNTLFFHAAHLNRIADAILLLSDVPDRTKYLKLLTSGSLDLFQRCQSPAKDTLWELELWSLLRKYSFNATLQEPPDIVVVFEDAKVGIACKKLYSEKHVQNILSEAVDQIETVFDFGIVALNLDDLIPSRKILRTPTRQTMKQVIDNFNVKFLHRHGRHFQKYLASGRLLSAIVSTGVLADIYTHSTRFNNARETTIWTIPGLSQDKKKQLDRFYMQLIH